MVTNKQAEERVKKAFRGIAPDTFEQILEKCQNGDCNPKVIKMPKRSGYVLRKIVSIAAALAIIISSGLVGFGIAKFESIATVISFDVNPSIQIELNKNDKIVRAEARNQDGQKVLGEMDLAGSDLSVAVNAIIGSMLRNGYIDELSNSILISVDNGDERKSAELERKLADEISILLSGEKFDAAVLSQTIKATKEIKALANEYGITLGKAQLIQKIIKADDKYNFKDLAPLTINELNLIASGEKIGIKTSGKASEKRYIGKSKAKKISLKDDGVNKEEISDYECKLKYKNGKMVYEISFKTQKAKYDYLIDATNGKIVKSEIERKEQGDVIASNPNQGVIKIDEATARVVALKTAGVLETDITGYNCVFNEGEVPHYSISFFVGDVAYSYNINAVTGELMTVSTQAPDNQTDSSQVSSDTDSSQPAESNAASSTTATSSAEQTQ